MSDVGAVEEVVASDACDIPQRIGACLGERGSFAHDEQHAAAEVRMRLPSAFVPMW